MTGEACPLPDANSVFLSFHCSTCDIQHSFKTLIYTMRARKKITTGNKITKVHLSLDWVTFNRKGCFDYNDTHHMYRRRYGDMYDCIIKDWVCPTVMSTTRHLGNLMKIQSLFPKFWGGAQDCTFLTSCQVMWIQLILMLLCEYEYHKCFSINYTISHWVFLLVLMKIHPCINAANIYWLFNMYQAIF